MDRGKIVVGVIAGALVGVMAYQSAAHAKQPSPVGPGVQSVDGKAIYLKSCRECHGVVGAPTKAALRKYPKIGNFTDPAFFKTRKHEDLIKAVEKGKGRDMKGFSEKLSGEEINAVVAYIHTLEKK